MTLRRRLILTIAAIALLLVVPAVVAVVQLRNVADIARSQRMTHGQAIQATGLFQVRVAELDRLVRSYTIDPDPGLRAETEAALRNAETQIARIEEAGHPAVAARAQQRLDTITQVWRTVEAMIAAGDQQAAFVRLEPLLGVFGGTQATLEALAAAIDTTASMQVREAQAIAAAAATTTLIALLVCLVAAVVLGYWATRAVTSPILKLRRAMALVADGEFRVPEGLPYDRRDEIGSVSRSFRSMTHRLADLDKLKAEFMSISTHELKTPINVISGYAELLQEGMYGQISERQEEALVSIREQARVLTQLVNQLLDISRLEAGGMRLEIHTVVVSDLIDRVRRAFEALAQKKQIEFSVEVDPSLPPTIAADGDRLRDQVLGNLLSNAFKFTPSGGRIDVRAWMDEDGVQIEVADTGPGIPADQLPFVFDKYYQVGGQARSKGSGLGLAIAHEVIEAHGGTITVESVPGRGTTFRITLPAEPSLPPSLPRPFDQPATVDQT